MKKVKSDINMKKFKVSEPEYNKVLRNGMKFFKFYGGDRMKYTDKIAHNQILRLIHRCLSNDYTFDDVIKHFHKCMKMERCGEIYMVYDISDFYETLGYLIVYYHTIYIRNNDNPIDDKMIDILQECYEAVTKVYPILLTKYNIKFWGITMGYIPIIPILTFLFIIIFAIGFLFGAIIF